MSIFHSPTTDQDGKPDSDFGQCNCCGRPLTFADHIEFLTSWLVDFHEQDPEVAIEIAEHLFFELDEASPNEKK